ncbi:hypothetical protein D3C86_1393230 [compost metagenome]
MAHDLIVPRSETTASASPRDARAGTPLTTPPRTCHLAAGLGTATANIGALLHQGVIAQALACLGAPGADLRANRAGTRMEARAAQHEVCARSADIHAIEQQANVLERRMPPAHFKAVGDRFQAEIVAIGAMRDAASHLGGYHASHRLPLSVFPGARA